MTIGERRQEAEAGSCVQQSILGLSFLYGDEVTVDYREALHWLTLAANQGASRAMLNLGRMYAQGLGVDVDVARAIELWDRLIARGDGYPDVAEARDELAKVRGEPAGD